MPITVRRSRLTVIGAETILPEAVAHNCHLRHWILRLLSPERPAMGGRDVKSKQQLSRAPDA